MVKLMMKLTCTGGGGTDLTNRKHRVSERLNIRTKYTTNNTEST